MSDETLVVLNKDLSFPGARVLLKDKHYFIYKVNPKSVYIGEKPFALYLAEYSSKPKQVTQLIFLENFGAFKVDMDVLKISTKEAEKKNEVEEIVSGSKRRPINKEGEKVIIDAFNNQAKKKKIGGGSASSGNKLLYFFYFNIPDRQVLLKIDDERWFYSIDTREFTKFDKEKHYTPGGIEGITWPKKLS